MVDAIASSQPKRNERSLSLIPIGLREASCDSPTFRALAIHFSDQVAIVEKWLNAYIKYISKLVADLAKIEESFNNVILRSVPPPSITEAIIDHDYTLLALNKYGESSRDWLMQTMSCMKRMESQISEPVKVFINGELRVFKEARRNLDQTQKLFDQMLARYVSQSKTKAPSALREDAFQVYEARKAYLKASFDFCTLIPHFRFTIDKLLIRISFDHWREIKRSSENVVSSSTKFAVKMERIRGWSKEIESSEAVFRRELHFARREIAEIAVETSKPSREIEDYNVSTVAFLASKPPMKTEKKKSEKGSLGAEKQGWLFLRIITGKPTRTSWVRRWFYVKAGIFGWLAQGTYSGAVEESGRIGVLLCNIKPAVQEDRRFCFEIKTKNQSVLLQAETQQILMEWLEVFERAKKTSILGNPNTSSLPDNIDFEISAPPTLSSVIKSIDSHLASTNDDVSGNMSDRFNFPHATGPDASSSSKGTIIDTNLQHRSYILKDEDEQVRDQTHRTVQRLDPVRKPGSALIEQSTSTTTGSLLSSGRSNIPSASNQAGSSLLLNETWKYSLAPKSLVQAPASTSLSKKAISLNSERHTRPTSEFDTGIPSVIVANFWGSSNWAYIDRLEKGRNLPFSNTKDDEHKTYLQDDENSKLQAGIEESLGFTIASDVAREEINHELSSKGNLEAIKLQSYRVPENLPANYPFELMSQDSQFRILFPGAPRSDILLLVFRVIWNHNEKQEFPGRIYVTQRYIYFYSHHHGLVLVTGVNMKDVSDITAAPGRDFDFIFLHMHQDIKDTASRIALKIFLEPFRLLQSRLSYLIHNSQAEVTASLEDILSTLVKMELENNLKTKPSWDSDEDISLLTRGDYGTERSQKLRNSVYGEQWPIAKVNKNEIAKIIFPSHPIDYEPFDKQLKIVERQFNIGSKALFHVIFGDNSHIFQKFYYYRGAENITQGPWQALDYGLIKREFFLEISQSNLFQKHQLNITDLQIIDIKEDHLRYIVSYQNTFWHLPCCLNFKLVFKIVITYVAKSKCKLAFYANVDWSVKPVLFKGIIERQALIDSTVLAKNLIEEITNQVRKLGPHSRTRKSLLIFGQVGQQSLTIKAQPKNFEPRNMIDIKQQTIFLMVSRVAVTYVQVAMNFIITFSSLAIKSIGKFTSANGLILFILFLSLLLNIIFTLRDTSNWWAERKAINFMTRVGVGPNQIISKAIYIKDFDEALNLSLIQKSNPLGGKCYNHFKWITNITDLNLPHHLAGTVFLDVTTQSAARRLLRIRQNLGSYRHSILVASRLINRIEKDIIQAEWENWLLDENIRCERVSLLLREDQMNFLKSKKNEFSADTTNTTNETWQKNKKLNALRNWKDVYCKSCAIEQELLTRRKDHTIYE